MFTFINRNNYKYSTANKYAKLIKFLAGAVIKNTIISIVVQSTVFYKDNVYLFDIFYLDIWKSGIECVKHLL